MGPISLLLHYAETLGVFSQTSASETQHTPSSLKAPSSAPGSQFFTPSQAHHPSKHLCICTIFCERFQVIFSEATSCIVSVIPICFVDMGEQECRDIEDTDIGLGGTGTLGEHA